MLPSCHENNIDLAIYNNSTQDLMEIVLEYNDANVYTKSYGTLKSGDTLEVNFPKEFYEGHINIFYKNKQGDTKESELVGYYTGGLPIININIDNDGDAVRFTEE
jgi:hypothetical protein